MMADEQHRLMEPEDLTKAQARSLLHIAQRWIWYIMQKRGACNCMACATAARAFTEVSLLTRFLGDECDWIDADVPVAPDTCKPN